MRFKSRVVSLFLAAHAGHAADIVPTETADERIAVNLAAVERRVVNGEVANGDGTVVLLRAIDAALREPDRAAAIQKVIAAGADAPLFRASWMEAPLLAVTTPGTGAEDFLTAVETIAFLAAADVVDRPAMALATAAIERQRKSDASVLVTDHDGRPRGGIAVTVELRRPEVRFGGNLYLLDRARTKDQNRAYENAFVALFDLATIPFYWPEYERVRGQPDYARTERFLSFAASHSLAVKGHPILWWHEGGRPSFDPFPAVAVEIQRVRDLVSRFRGRIRAWEVVNEPAHTGQPVDAAYRAARESDAKAELIVNDFQIFHDGYPGYLELLRGMIGRAVPFDGIGIQGHYPLDSRFPLADVTRALETYAALGKALHVTEITPPSAGQAIVGGELRGNWNEALQAEYAHKLYLVCFSNPGVASIIWWDLSDQASWQQGGGLLRDDMSPKPAYRALHDLIHGRFKTHAEGKTDDAGVFRFRGHRGEYRVKVEGAAETSLRVRAGGLNLAAARLATTSAKPKP